MPWKEAQTHHLIVVPLDGSEFAEAALSTAVALARRTDGRLELVMVHQIPLTGANLAIATEVDARIHRDEAAYLAQQSDGIKTARASVTHAVLDGPVVSALVEHVRSRRASLVVMSTHGRGGLSRFFLGNTADRLIRQAHCPVLLTAPGRSTALERGDSPRVLIPLDGSPLAESIVGQLDVAVSGSATLELLRVVVPPMIALSPIGGAAPTIAANVLEEEITLAEQYLQRVGARLREKGFTVRTVVVPDLSPASVITAHARDHACDAIAIATRGLGGVERAVLGSVADKVIRAAQVPVLVWNPPSASGRRGVEAKAAQATAAPRDARVL